MEEQYSSTNWRLSIRYLTNRTVRVDREAPNCLAIQLLKFYYASARNAKDDKVMLLLIPKCKAFCNKSILTIVLTCTCNSLFVRICLRIDQNEAKGLCKGLCGIFEQIITISKHTICTQGQIFLAL